MSILLSHSLFSLEGVPNFPLSYIKAPKYNTKELNFNFEFLFCEIFLSFYLWIQGFYFILWILVCLMGSG